VSLPRRSLLAYLVGAGVAGTALVLPYTGRAVATVLVPELVVVEVPFFLLPIVWGLWNVVYVRLAPRMGPGPWGALLGAVAGVSVNLLLWVRGQWFPPAALLLMWLPIVYGLAWLFVIAPLDDAVAAG
jgi:hypothetical protein